MPIKPLKYSGNGILQVMSSIDIGKLATRVGEHLASEDGPGSIYLSPNIGTLIGTFTDTRYAGNVGEGDVTITSVDYNLYQDMSTPTGNDPPPLLQYKDNTSPIVALTDQEYEELASSLLTIILFNAFPGVYVLGTSLPDDGGTWVSLGELKDVRGTTIDVPELSYYIYKLIDVGFSYTIDRPLTLPEPNVIQSFTDTQIEYLTKKVREVIVNTGIGTYALAEIPPDPLGVWIDCGTITDLRANIEPSNYNIAFQETYTASEEVAYENVVPDSVDYTSDIITYYTGDSNFTGDSFYTGPGNVYTLTSFRSSPAYYTRLIPAYYAGPVVYTAANSFNVFVDYVGPGPTLFFTGFFASVYTRDAVVNYTRVWVTFGPDYEGPIGNAYFFRLLYYVSNFVFFRQPVNVYAREIYYVRNYVGPGSRTFTFPFVRGPLYYVRDPVYTGNFQNSFAAWSPDYTAVDGRYIRNNPAAPGYFSSYNVTLYWFVVFPYTVYYTRYWTSFFTTYFAQNFALATESSYNTTLTYTLDLFYTNENATPFSGPFNLTFQGALTYTREDYYTEDIPYSGLTNYLGESGYETIVSVGYLGASSTNYTTLNDVEYTMVYESVYEGSIINNVNETISTLTLWRRVQ